MKFCTCYLPCVTTRHRWQRQKSRRPLAPFFGGEDGGGTQLRVMPHGPLHDRPVPRDEVLAAQLFHEVVEIAVAVMSEQGAVSTVERRAEVALRPPYAPLAQLPQRVALPPTRPTRRFRRPP